MHIRLPFFKKCSNAVSTNDTLSSITAHPSIPEQELISSHSCPAWFIIILYYNHCAIAKSLSLWSLTSPQVECIPLASQCCICSQNDSARSPFTFSHTVSHWPVSPSPSISTIQINSEWALYYMCPYIYVDCLDSCWRLRTVLKEGTYCVCTECGP